MSMPIFPPCCAVLWAAFLISWIGPFLSRWLQVTGRIRSLAGGQFLEIQDAQPQDGGHYSCVVSNAAGSTSLSFVVKILCEFITSGVLLLMPKRTEDVHDHMAQELVWGWIYQNGGQG